MGDVFHVCGVCGRKDNKSGRCEYCGPLFDRIRRRTLDEVEREIATEAFVDAIALVGVRQALTRLRDKPGGTP